MRNKIKSLAIGFAILIAIQFSANCVLTTLHIAFPSPLLGMVVLALLLQFKIIPMDLIKDICELLLKNMALFFVPLFVGIMSYEKLIKANLVPIALTIIITTFVTMLLSAFFVDAVIKMTQKDKTE